MLIRETTSAATRNKTGLVAIAMEPDLSSGGAPEPARQDGESAGGNGRAICPCVAEDMSAAVSTATTGTALHQDVDAPFSVVLTDAIDELKAQ
ncbi:hypothetical protein PI124_g16546 [Phytophthora idaei]|nr:hypothetical protein PI125_g13680 [Phytophthora idaei]KAG3145604.1 hypothetical protein PI126_g13666 [Phytophthora idaei]KAG3238501.1 hypothetical protein PI124_g16546 [Phytophthora idaei]